jgi:hypothetical protein
MNRRALKQGARVRCSVSCAGGTIAAHTCALQTAETYGPLKHTMYAFTKIFGRHEIDEWRDRHTLGAAAVLNDVAAELVSGFEPELKSATWREVLVTPGSVIAARVALPLREVAEAIVGKIIDRANKDLQEIVAYQAVWNNVPREFSSSGNSSAAIRDVALAAGPIAGGIATAVALPAMAVTTSTALFGLITTSVISWPAVAIGGTIVGASLATGVLNGSKIRSNAEARLRKNVHDFIVQTLLKGKVGQPSILEQLTVLFAETAAEAKRL